MKNLLAGALAAAVLMPTTGSAMNILEWSNCLS